MDSCLWFRMRDFKGISKFKNITSSSWMQWTSPLIARSPQHATSVTTEGAVANQSSTATGSRPSFFSDGRQTRTQADIEQQTGQPRVSVEEDFGLDIDLSPQLNMALREEVPD